MIAVPNKEQIKYTSATIQDERVYKKLKLFVLKVCSGFENKKRIRE